MHALLFLEHELETEQVWDLRGRLFGRWENALKTKGLSVLPEYGIDLRPVTSGNGIADYFAKNTYGVTPGRAAYEVTGSHSKRLGKGGLTPFQLLQHMVETGDARYHKEALDALKDAATRDPDDPLTWRLMATIYGQQGHESEATLYAAEEAYAEGDADFRGQLTKIKGLNAQVLIVPGYYKEVGLIVKQARDLGLNIPMMGGDGWDSHTLTDVGGQYFHDCYFSDHFSPEEKRPEVEEFVKAFRAKYNEEPDAMAALGYDAVKLVDDGYGECGGLAGSGLCGAYQVAPFEHDGNRFFLDWGRVGVALFGHGLKDAF